MSAALPENLYQFTLDDDHSLVEKAVEILNDGNHSDAVDLLNDARSINPYNSIAVFYKSEALRAAGNREQSLNLISDLVEDYPEWARLKLQRGLLSLDEGDIQRGEQLILSTLKSGDMEYSDYMYIMCRLDSGDYTDLADRAAEAISASSASNMTIGLVFGDTGRLDESREIFERLGQDSDQDNERTQALVKYNLACVYSKLGEADESIDSLSKAIDLNQAHVRSARTDADFDNIRENPRFAELLESEE